MCKRKKYKEVQDIFYAYDAILISKEYKNNKTPLKYICQKHNDKTEQEVTLDFLNTRKKLNCFLCRENELYEKHKKSAISLLKAKNATFVDFEYVDYSKSKAHYTCNVHDDIGIQTTTLWSLKNSKNVCVTCATQYKAKKRTEKTAPRVLETLSNKGYQLIGEYTKTKDKFNFICKKHPYKVQSTSGTSVLQYDNNCKWCRYEKTSGENSNWWKGGISDENKRFRETKEYDFWRTQVFIRDNYTCLACGEKGGKLNAHHKVNYSSNPELRLSTSNGATLCECCHMGCYKGSFHNTYGVFNNTNEQFEEFLQLRKEKKLIKHTVKISDMKKHVD